MHDAACGKDIDCMCTVCFMTHGAFDRPSGWGGGRGEVPAGERNIGGSSHHFLIFFPFTKKTFGHNKHTNSHIHKHETITNKPTHIQFNYSICLTIK